MGGFYRYEDVCFMYGGRVFSPGAKIEVLGDDGRWIPLDELPDDIDREFYSDLGGES